MAHHPPQAAGSGQTDQALGLVPDPAQSSRMFWAAAAVNDDTLLRTYIQVACPLEFVEKNMLVQRAIYAAESDLWMEKNRSFQEARKAGVLLFAWYGSSALEGGAA